MRLRRRLQKPPYAALHPARDLVVGQLIVFFHERKHSMPTPFLGTPGSVKSLRRYWKDRVGSVSIEHIRAELLGQSDRSAIILMATLLDDALAALISTKITIHINEFSLYDHIFRFEGPLGSFSHRIELAFLFGFINEGMRSKLSDIREMRNACAHSPREISFAVPALVSVAKRLFYPNSEAALTGTSQSEVRAAFIESSFIIFRTLCDDATESLAKLRATQQETSPEKQP
jgi:hypothetical protein